MVIDANLYWIPEELFTDSVLQKEFLDCIPAKYGWYGRIEKIDGTDKKQFIIEKPRGYANLNYVQGEYRIEKELADMDRAGVDRAVMKLPGCQEWLTLNLCRYFNDKAAEHAKKSNGRLTALAVVPPFAGEDNLRELERCRSELGMKTVQLSAHYGDKYLDDEAFAPFFNKLNSLHMNAYVHHTPVPVEYKTFCTYNNVRRSYGRIVDQGLAIGRELYSGFFSRYPDVHLAHSMMGGAFYAIRDMMLPHGARKNEEISRFQYDSGDIEKQLRSNIVF